MSGEIVLALDGMGGDNAPGHVFAGADAALSHSPELRFLIYGPEEALGPCLEGFPRLRSAVELRPAPVAIGMGDKPSQALRRGRKVSSMWRALDAVHQGEAAAAVSGGNTGALMAMARFVLKTQPSISRPGIAALWPNMKGFSVVIDLGATIGSSADQLVQFAIMGEACARVLLGKERPAVGLLNIGVEEVKGTEAVREAARFLREADLPLTFRGFIEGDALSRGEVDVIVTDGFSGNIALKVAEGTARQIGAYLSDAFRRSWRTRLGYFLLRPALRPLRARMDPRRFDGGVFLGLNGVAVKGHGGGDGVSFCSAIETAVLAARADLPGRIAADMRMLGEEPGGRE